MKVSCIQMNVRLGETDLNYAHAESLIKDAMRQSPDTDVLVLPEMWNVGFFPHESLEKLCDRDGKRTKAVISALAARYRVNIVAGSVADMRDGKLYNTSYIFDRDGNNIASYDKINLFSPSGEHNFFEKGDRLCRFKLDGLNCSVIICYDIRFPELTRELASQNNKADLLFVVAEWPQIRISQLRILVAARAIENKMFVACCNACGEAAEKLGGGSLICDPSGTVLADAFGKTTVETIIDSCIDDARGCERCVRENF